MYRSLLALTIMAAPAGSTGDATVFRRAADILEPMGFSVWHVPSPPATNFPLYFHGQFVDRQRRIDLRFNASQIPTTDAKVRLLREVGSGSGGRTPEGSLTGVRLGEECRHEVLDRLWSLNVVADRFHLQGSGTISIAVPQGVNAEARREFTRAICERLVRGLLADAMALDLDDEGRAQATATLTGCETNKQGFTTLARWAQERSVTVSYDENTASASFSRNGKSVKLYLSSDRAVVNGQEFPLGGKFVMARGSRWFVPKAELDAATSP